MRVLLLIIALTASMFFLGTSPKAKQSAGVCKNVKNTADILACANKNHEKAQNRLNDIYEKVLSAQEGEAVEEVRSAQKDWIIYRDKECAWESKQVETESLSRIEELNCLADLTKQRTTTLMKSLESVELAEEQEVDYLPRWMNVVSNDYPETFWRYGDYLSADLDCDGEDEKVMAGQKISYSDVRLEGASPHTVSAVIAVSDNPMTGRPEPALFPLNVSASEESGDLCDPNIQLSVIEAEIAEDRQCERFLEIKDSKCAPLKLYWDGSAYKVLSMPGG